MTLRLATIDDQPPALRASKRIAWVAAALDCDEKQIRALIDSGELEGHGIGKRGVRVYLDSVTAYQERNARQAKSPTNPEVKPPRRRAPASQAAHNSAMAYLRRHGLA